MGKQVGTYISVLRQERRLSMRQLGHRVGISASYLSLIERGQRDATIQTLYPLVKGLNGDFVQVLHLLAIDAGVPLDALSQKTH